MSIASKVAPLLLVVVAAACDKSREENKGAPPAAPPSAPPAASSSAAPSATSASLPSFDRATHTNPFVPLSETVEKPSVDDTVKLGQMLYFDARFSRGHDVSCASCHDLARAGADGEAASVGTKKRKGKRNTPTVLNAAGGFAQGWDARASTIEELVATHVLDPDIMGMDEKRLVATIESIPAYSAAFRKAFPHEGREPSVETFARAVAAYTNKLFTRSRWDRFLAGDASALTEQELVGLATFVEAGCITCHQGKYLGATQTQKLGIAKPWPGPAGEDPGRFAITKQESDRGMFKVPTLRNVAKTGPYLHDGSVATLAEVTRLMALHQIGRELPPARVDAIVTFLGALDGDPPKELVKKPTLPPSGPKTPRPE